MKISAILFDFDGTLTRPHGIDFPAIKHAIGCPPDEPAWEFILAIADEQERWNAEEVLARYEMAAAAAAEPNTGAEEAVSALLALGLPLAVLTRNSRVALDRAFKNFDQIREDMFVTVLTRDDGHEPKPDPEGMLKAAAALGVPAAELLCVGDYKFDVEGAANAGARSAFLTNGGGAPPAEPEADFVIEQLAELVAIARRHRPLPAGKLPNALLQEFLGKYAGEDKDLLTAPGVGEDCAVVDLGRAGLAALKTDPITFATDDIGYYAVHVNANDIAAAGAVPKWLLTTLLFPVRSTAAEVEAVMQQLAAAAADVGVTLGGGHTEITDAVIQPVVCGQMIGTFGDQPPVRKQSLAAGDRVLLTKRVAVEGTAIIARELPARLTAAGVAATVIEAAAAFLHDPGISVLPEARAAVAAGGVSAMHDVTEGGLATAVEELSIAGNRGIQVDSNAIPVYDETTAICEALGLDPLGLIGSGSLLLACRPESTAAVCAGIQAAGVDVAVIGVAVDGPAGVRCSDGEWPEFPADEIARLFAQTARHGRP